ncbi:MAG: hypothetical protein H0V46_09045, partial [Sphingomonas sp.]|nr:hypothetical protein [Sphingomonas sp.]
MSKIRQVRLLREQAIGPLEMPASVNRRSIAPRPARSVTVNLAESPLGCLFSRGLLSKRQYDAGERLRHDWEQSQLAPNVTMSWDAAPVARGRGGSSAGADPSASQIDARSRFDAA